MNRFSFFAFFAVLCVALAAVPDFDDLTPNNDKGFLDDFFSDTSSLLPSSDVEKAKKLIASNHATPRYTFISSNWKLKRVPALFCLPKLNDSSSSFEDVNNSHLNSSSSSDDGTYDLDSCQWMAYTESLLLLSGVTFIIAVIVFPIMFFGLGIGRCCCCGRYKPTPSLCCGDPDEFDPTINGYTKCSVLVLLIISIVCCVVLAAAAGVGIAGSVEMSESAVVVVNFTNQTTFKFVDILNSVIDVFKDLKENGQNVSEVIDQETLEKAAQIGNNISHATDFIASHTEAFEVPRQAFVFVTLILPFILMVLVIVSRFACWWLSWGMAFCGFIITFLALGTFGVLYPVASGVSDACVFLDDALRNGENDTFIQSFFQCGEDAPLGKFSKMADDVIEKAANMTCEFLEGLNSTRLPCGHGSEHVNPSDLCSVIVFPGGTFECNTSSFSRIVQDARIENYNISCYRRISSSEYEPYGECNSDIHSTLDPSVCSESNSMLFYCYNDNIPYVTFSECASNCSDQQILGNVSQAMMYVVTAARAYDIYDEKIRPYLNCETLLEIVFRARDFACVNVVNSTIPLYVGEIMAAAASLVGTFVALLSVKRFQKRYRREYAIYQEKMREVPLV